MKKQQRLTGIDLFRGLAMYAVIIVHIDEGVEVLPPTWLKVTNFASFCVPFFLAAAFYFAINKLYRSQDRYPLRLRLERLLIPYGVWSALYLLYKSAKYLAAGESGRLLELFQDPLSLVFFGGASYHLYFLPLLAMGTLLVKLVEFLITRKFSLKAVGLIALISLLVYEVVLFSGNGLKEPGNIAFEPLLAAIFPEGNSNPLLRLLLVELAWALRCLPYIMVAMLLTHPAANTFSYNLITKHSAFWALLFLAINIFSSGVLPDAVGEISRGYSALIVALSISSFLKEDPLIKNIGFCSFGIYLVHIFFVETFQSIAIRLYPEYVNSVSIFFLLAATTTVFISSWVTTILLMRNEKISHVLYGI